ncbi:MAG: sulfatase [Phycisphaerales bacterium]|nr:sulfatase [Phycisphaerales bacterium]
MLTAAAIAPGFLRAATPAKKLNVLFIAVDDLRPELGCYGHKWIKSPNIDKLAAGGTVFNRAYCQVAVCGASRASLLTGLRPTPKRFLTYYTHAEKDAPGVMTLPGEFRKNGYECISNGKIFHHRNDTEKQSWTDPAWRPRVGGAVCLDPKSKKLKGGKKNRGPWFEGPDVPDNAYGDGQTADKTIQDLKKMKKSGKPFFLACGFYKPHLPFYAPKKYWDMYDREKIALAENRDRPKNAPKMLKGSGEIHSYHNRNLKYNSDAWHAAGRHGYYACVSYIDAQVGKVLNTLDELGLRDSTIVILWGDHGWHLGEHNFWGKHNVMHLATNSPMIVSAPGHKGGQTSERLTEFVDIYPGLCELAGIKPQNKGLQGTSFAPLMKAPDRPWKKAAFSKYGPAVSLITDRHNYAEFKNGERMLYDLKADPAENVNIAEDPKNKDLVASLAKMLHAGYESVKP